MMLKLVFVLVLVDASFAKAPSKRSVECSENEIFVECAHCGPKSCTDLGFRSPCKGASSGCKEECVCDDGFVRDDKGVCINKKDCPSCGGDPNAVSGCGNYCGNSCSDYHEPNKTCRTGCRYNSCDCRVGFVFDDDVGKCVLKEKCNSPWNLVRDCDDKGAEALKLPPKSESADDVQNCIRQIIVAERKMQ